MNTVLAFLLAVISVTLACKCQTQTPQQAFCNAHWVSHIRVKIRITKQPLPAGSSRKGLNNIKYAVNHIKVFKKPQNMTEMPIEIYTPSESPACGLIIEAGKEYLLAGRLENGNTLFTVLCGQVLPDDSTRTTFENVLEWKNVPPKLLTDMAGFKC